VVAAARQLFLRNGYAGTTMDEIAAVAGLTKRTVYNNYGDKDALFVQVVGGVTAFADEFAAGLRREFADMTTPATVRSSLEDIARRLALRIVHADVVAIRRLLIGEARTFPELAKDYFDRAPGQVLRVLSSGFGQLTRAGLLRAKDSRSAAAQFAYLVAGEPLDRAVLTGAIPAKEQVLACAREGVETFLARYATI
jgi:TetR/AcrR family transcriptional repressor of mexJK operon